MATILDNFTSLRSMSCMAASEPLPPDWTKPLSDVRAMCFVRTEQGRPVLATADAGGDIHLYDGPTGKTFRREDGTEVRVGNRSGNPIYDMSYLPRSGGWPRLVTVGGGGTTHIYDLTVGKESVRVLRNERLRVVDVLHEPDGPATIAVGGISDTVHLWRGNCEEPVALPGHMGPVRALKVLPGEHRLAVAHEGGITVWNVSEQPPTVAVRFGHGDIRSLAVIRDSLGRLRLASACPHGIKSWDPVTGDELAHYARSLSVSTVAAFEAQDGDPLLAAASDKTITLWSPATEEPSLVRLPVVHQGTITELARIPTSEGNLFAAADADLVAVWLLPSQPAGPDVCGSHDDWVNALAIVPARGDRSALLASASDDRTVGLWKVSARQPREQSPARLPHDSQVQALAVVSDRLATGDENGVVRVWSPPHHGSEPWYQRALPRPKVPCGPVRAMVSFAQGTRLVSAGGSAHCILWDAADSKFLRYLRPPVTGTSSDSDVVVRALAAFEVAGRWLVAAGDSTGRIEIWDAEDPAVHWTLARAHPAQVRSLAVVSAGSQVWLASGGDDGAIRLWAPSRTGPVLAAEKLGAHRRPVAALHPVRVGKRQFLASAGADRSIRLWDPASLKQPVGEVTTAHNSWVRALSQVPAASRTWLASGGEDGTIRLWQVSNDGQLLHRMHDFSMLGFRDRLAKTDLLDRHAIAEELRERLSPKVTEAPSGTSGPQVVMIQGPWGTGKSSVMHELRIMLDEAEESPNPLLRTDDFMGSLGQRWRRWRRRGLSPFQAQRLMRAPPRLESVEPQPVRHSVTAWFNPWAHESSEQVWSGLAWSIIDATRDKLGSRESERQGYWLSRNVPRLDCAVLRRAIHQRIWRPTLATLVALLVPLTVALVNGRADLLTQLPESASGWVLIAVGAVFLLLTIFTVWQYFFGRITTYLPLDIVDGPVLPTSSISTAGEKLRRDLPYLTTTGLLYRTKKDVHNLVKDLQDRGYQVVVFIDDLDRCTDRSITEVFEAVNSFLFNQDDSDAAPRFVIGLDPSVVAGRLRDKYCLRDQAITYQDPDDPDPGWSLLRKLCQLTVVLPGIRSAHTVRLLRQHTHTLPDANQSAPLTQAGSHALAGSEIPGTENLQPPAVQPTRTPAREVSDSPPLGGVIRQANPQLLPLEALEGDPTIQEHLRQLVMLRPRQTMRETKRLLTLWGFYVGLLQRVMPDSATANALGACDVLTLAEIIRRWPALVPALTRTGDGPSGLSVLIEAAREQDHQSAKWSAALAQLGLSRPEYGPATANLQELLLKYGNETVADFADCLL